MTIEEIQPPSSEEDSSEDTYHDPNILVRIATWADPLAWVVLVIYLAQYLILLYAQIRSGIQLDINNVYGLINSTSTFLSGVFIFVVLKAISEGINILLDIFENTQLKEKSR